MHSTQETSQNLYLFQLFAIQGGGSSADASRYSSLSVAFQLPRGRVSARPSGFALQLPTVAFQSEQTPVSRVTETGC